MLKEILKWIDDKPLVNIAKISMIVLTIILTLNTFVNVYYHKRGVVALEKITKMMMEDQEKIDEVLKKTTRNFDRIKTLHKKLGVNWQ